MAAFTIATVDSGNLDELGMFCVLNRKHPGYIAKRAWLQSRLQEGMRLKLILTEDGKRAGFLEYTHGASTWRVVHAPNHFVIHCFWVKSGRFPYKGMASALLEECLDDARTHGKDGVAVVASDGTWMASRGVFDKYGFGQVDSADPHFQLLVKRIGEGTDPAFPDNWHERLTQYQGLNLIYTNQCPYIGKVVPELRFVAEQHGIQLTLLELNDPAEARARMPSPYGVISLVHDGRLLVDHPFSVTRFKNILRKELGLAPGS